jgi:hypothetical protein
VVLAAILTLVLALAEPERPPAMRPVAWLRVVGVTLQTLFRGS